MKVYQFPPVLFLIFILGNISIGTIAAPTDTIDIDTDNNNDESIVSNATTTETVESEVSEEPGIENVTIPFTSSTSTTTTDRISTSTAFTPIDRIDSEPTDFVDTRRADTDIGDGGKYDDISPIGANPLDQIAYSLLIEHLKRPPPRIATEDDPIITGYYVMDTEMNGDSPSPIANTFALGSSEVASLPEGVRPPLITSKSVYGLHSLSSGSAPQSNSDQAIGSSSNDPQQLPLQIVDISQVPLTSTELPSFLPHDILPPAVNSTSGYGVSPNGNDHSFYTTTNEEPMQLREEDRSKYGIHILSPFSDKAIGNSFTNTLAQLMKSQKIKQQPLDEDSSFFGHQLRQHPGFSFSVAENPSSTDVGISTSTASSFNPFDSSIPASDPIFYDMEELNFQKEAVTETSTAPWRPIYVPTISTTPKNILQTQKAIKHQQLTFGLPRPTALPKQTSGQFFQNNQFSIENPRKSQYGQLKKPYAVDVNTETEMDILQQVLQSGSHIHQVAKNQSGYDVIQISPDFYEKLMQTGSLKHTPSGNPIFEFRSTSTTTPKSLFPTQINPTHIYSQHHSVPHRTPDSSELMKHPEIFTKSHYQKPIIIYKNNELKHPSAVSNVLKIKPKNHPQQFQYQFLQNHPVTPSPHKPTTISSQYVIPIQTEAPKSSLQYVSSLIPLPQRFSSIPSKSHQNPLEKEKSSSDFMAPNSASSIQKAVEIITKYSDDFVAKTEKKHFSQLKTPINVHKPINVQNNQYFVTSTFTPPTTTTTEFRPQNIQTLNFETIFNPSQNNPTTPSPAAVNLIRNELRFPQNYPASGAGEGKSQITYGSIDLSPYKNQRGSTQIQLFRDRNEMESAIKSLIRSPASSSDSTHSSSQTRSKYSTVIVRPPTPSTLSSYSRSQSQQSYQRAFNKGAPPIPLNYKIFQSIVREVL